MPTFMEQGADWLVGQLKVAAGVPIEYARGILTPRSITAVPTRLDHERFGDLLEEMGGRVSAWIIQETDLGVYGEPERGDRITDLNLAVVFELVPLGDARCWEYADNRRQFLRVVGVEVGEVGGI